MLGMAAAQWRVRFRRSLALLSMITVAVVGFTLLTAAAVTARLDATGTVEANFRPAYDILIRPTGSVLPLEQQRNLVQSGQLAGLRGGITVEQWHQIQHVPGVAVAAPVAVIGYVIRTVPVTVQLGADLDPAAERQVIKVQPTWVTDAGLSRIPDGAAYLYSTRNVLHQKQLSEMSGGEGIPPAEEVDPGGGRRQVCPVVQSVGERDFIDPTDLTGRSSLTCVGGPGSRDVFGDPVAPVVTLAWSVPFLMAAVDPGAEAALAGLDTAVTSGRYFTAGEQPAQRRLDGMPYPYDSLPILVADKPQLDARLELQIQRLGGAAVDLVRAGTDNRGLRAALDGQPGTRLATRTVPIDGPYQDMVDRLRHPFERGPDDMAVSNTLWLDRFWTVGPARTTADGDGLRTEPAPYDLKIWGLGADAGDSGHPVPMEFADTGVRGAVAAHPNITAEHDVQPGDIAMPDVALDAVGTFDPSRVRLGGALSAVPMDTYFNPGAEGADDASRKALNGRRLEPNANVSGLLSQPPLMLTTMGALPVIFGPDGYGTKPEYPEYQLNRAAPISMVRVRLAGTVGMGAADRERVRLVAEQLARRTGLQVDITLGSSPTGVTVQYPAGRFGRPDLAVSEPWVRKGVAAVLVHAADRKSVLLSGLVLVVCALAVLNATNAATRARRTDLGVLACLGWSRRQLLHLLLTEITGIGLAAGIAGTLLAVPLAAAFGLDIGWPRALLAIPVALLLAVAAGLWPALRAARPDPAVAVRPAVSAPSARRRGPRRVTGLALTYLARTPGRAALGAGSLAIGVAALTMLLAITFAFRGAVVGTLLGEAIAVQARTVDYLAVAVTIALGVASVADVLFLGISERSGELALLGAAGWHDGLLRRLVVTEAVAIGVLGGATGAGVGLGAAALFSGALTTPLVWCAAIALTAGVAVSAVAATVPIAILHRLPIAQLLAEE
ncbi:FtsX-like permease family protein [Dactylosporangium sp. NPDC049742]|uniref:FtsX-like permease family protein n=1 Tax=Dactylosporangium sp. NPDC049742 TaxID=3154737 RepID=UPI00341974C3